MNDGNKLIATIITTTSGGSFHSAICPYCGKSKLLGQELLIMQAFCDSCRKPFDLRYPNNQEIKCVNCEHMCSRKYKNQNWCSETGEFIPVGFEFKIKQLHCNFELCR